MDTKHRFNVKKVFSHQNEQNTAKVSFSVSFEAFLRKLTKKNLFGHKSLFFLDRYGPHTVKLSFSALLKHLCRH